MALAVGALPTLLSCRTTQATLVRHPGDEQRVDPAQVDPLFAEAWAAVTELRDRDPAAPEIPGRVDALLALGPPVELRMAALLAKAQQAYAVRRDPDAVLAADQALSGVAIPTSHPPAVVVELMVVRARAMVRGGDPSRALVALDEPLLRAPGVLDPIERLSLRAVALDRNGQYAEAVVAHARWRAQVSEDTAAAVYAERRIDALGSTLERRELEEAWRDLPADHARACLEAKFAGVDPPAGSPAWVRACAEHGLVVGLLLPRSGPLSALADPQLAAASIAAASLGTELGVQVSLRFADAGSTAGSARAGASALEAAGATVVVGPVGADNVRAVTAVIPERVEVVVPGETIGRAVGVAPTLESRMRALVERGRGLGVTRFVVAYPDNGYGRRAVAALDKILERSESKSLIIQKYSADTTSFAPTIAPMMPALGKGAAILVPDTLKRTELLVRQLARAGHPPSPDGVEGTVVLSTAEGGSEAGVGRGHEVLEGMWVSLVAAAAGDPGAERFAEAYAQAEGEPPSDQALLVYFALRRALLQATGDSPPPAVTPARTVRVEEGRFVVESTSPR